MRRRELDPDEQDERDSATMARRVIRGEPNQSSLCPPSTRSAARSSPAPGGDAGPGALTQQSELHRLALQRQKQQ